MAKLSVIIPAYRRHPLTVRHVEECLKSTRLPDEIIVVNDGGDPNLRDMLLEIPRKMDILYARVEQDILWNYNGACNLGFWISTGDIFIIEDTDHVPTRNLYEKTVEFFEKYPDCDRLAYNRNCVNISELLKPMEEWTWPKNWGPNQMVAALTRQSYLRLKGQEERFGGHYGYMCYDWKNRYNNILKIKSMKAGVNFHAIIGDEGEPGLRRGMSQENRRIYRENALSGHPQHPKGILNFTYTIEKLPKNI